MQSPIGAISLTVLVFALPVAAAAGQFTAITGIGDCTALRAVSPSVRDLAKAVDATAALQKPIAYRMTTPSGNHLALTLRPSSNGTDLVGSGCATGNCSQFRFRGTFANESDGRFTLHWTPFESLGVKLDAYVHDGELKRFALVRPEDWTFSTTDITDPFPILSYQEIRRTWRLSTNYRGETVLTNGTVEIPERYFQGYLSARDSSSPVGLDPTGAGSNKEFCRMVSAWRYYKGAPPAYRAREEAADGAWVALVAAESARSRRLSTARAIEEEAKKRAAYAEMFPPLSDTEIAARRRDEIHDYLFRNGLLHPRYPSQSQSRRGWPQEEQRGIRSTAPNGQTYMSGMGQDATPR